MKRRLTLKSEHLTDLTDAELSLAGGAGNELFTGNPVCILSIRPPCVTNQFCTVFCIQTVGE